MNKATAKQNAIKLLNEVKLIKQLGLRPDVTSTELLLELISDLYFCLGDDPEYLESDIEDLEHEVNELESENEELNDKLDSLIDDTLSFLKQLKNDLSTKSIFTIPEIMDQIEEFEKYAKYY